LILCVIYSVVFLLGRSYTGEAGCINLVLCKGLCKQFLSDQYRGEILGSHCVEDDSCCCCCCALCYRIETWVRTDFW
jgi:hypothetical protein